MGLSAGSRLGPYEILGLLGAGGMGEVYRARDPRLGRDVAVKVIAFDASRDRDRLRRFEQEARAVAAINHPNILSIHDVGSEAGSPYLVLELLQGESLRAHIVGQRLARRTALDFAVQIARGLSAAHEQGVVHRDLKPDNVFVTTDGRAKILDFGLAKLVWGDGKAGDRERTVSAETSPGTLLGTAGYMSPEQLRGETADARSDIFSFGVVLYEMLAGRKPFRGATPAEVMAAILREEPVPLSDAGAPVAPALNWITARCLEKQPQDRFHSAHDLALALEGVAGAPGPFEATASQPAAARRRVSRVFALAVLALGAFGLWSLRGRAPLDVSPMARPVTRLALEFPDGTRVAQSYPSVAISRDGTTLALVARNESAQQLYVRPMNGWEWKPLPGTEGAASPFFSPDGEWIAFFSPNRLKRVSRAGGAPQVICEIKSVRAGLASGTWSDDGQILFGAWPDPGLWRVPAAGGVAESLRGTEKLGKRATWYRGPQVLPGGRNILFGTWTAGSARVEALSLETHERQTLIAAGSDPFYASTGHLVYGWDNQLLVAPFALGTLEPRGVPVPVVDGVRMHYGRVLIADYALSETGSLVYVPGRKLEKRLVWADHLGRITPLPFPHRDYGFPALSPDVNRIAVTISEGPGRDVWIGDLARGTLSRLTTDGDAVFAVWTPDLQHVLYTSSEQGPYNIFRKRSDGSGSPERLTQSPNAQRPTSLTHDGRRLLFNDMDATMLMQIGLLPLDEPGRPTWLVHTAANEMGASFSPDGRWLVYESDESGRFEIYAQAYPGPGPRMLVSIRGGRTAIWNRNGREIFYVAAERLMSASFEPGAKPRIGKPRALSRIDTLDEAFEHRPHYDVSADGKRVVFVENAAPGTAQPRLNVVLNWFEELRQRAPTR